MEEVSYIPLQEYHSHLRMRHRRPGFSISMAFHLMLVPWIMNCVMEMWNTGTSTSGTSVPLSQPSLAIFLNHFLVVTGGMSPLP